MAPKTEAPWYIGAAMEATEMGFRVIANELNMVLKTKKVRRRFQTNLKRKDDTLQAAVRQWREALPGLRTHILLGSEREFSPWCLGHLGDGPGYVAYFSLEGLVISRIDPRILPSLASGFVLGVFDLLLKQICSDLIKYTKTWTPEDWATRILDTIESHHLEVEKLLGNIRDPIGVSFLTPNSPLAESFSGAVKLYKRGEPPIVNGKKKKTLTDGQYATVKAVIESGQQGIPQKELIKAANELNVRKILEHLRKDPDWNAVILMSGQSKLGYRIT